MDCQTFGSRLLKAGVAGELVRNYATDPQVNYDGGKTSLFDLLEDHDAAACLVKARAVVAGLYPSMARSIEVASPAPAESGRTGSGRAPAQA